MDAGGGVGEVDEGVREISRMEGKGCRGEGKYSGKRELVPTSCNFDLPLQILEDPDGGCTLRVEVRLLLLRLRRRELGVGRNEAFEYRRENSHDHLTMSLFARR